MKSLILVCCLLLLGTVSFSQDLQEFIPKPVKAEVDARLSVYGPQLAALRSWAQNRRSETASTDTSTNARPFASHVLFNWPMRVNSNYDNIPSYYVISNYVDINRDNNSGTNEDWFCYTGLNYRYHEGHDYNLYPFFWRMMENENVFASAAQDGIVIEVVDTIGNSYNCMRNAFENNNGNHVSILNADSSISRYYHIKTGTALVAEGQFIQQGKLLANIASSGHSSNPHLHFDLQYYRTNTGRYNFIEPSKKDLDTARNPCNPFTEDSWWSNPKPYLESKLNRVMTHYAAPKLRGLINGMDGVGFCYEEEDARVKNQFQPGEVVVVGIALTHPYSTDSVFIRIYFPNGSLLASVPVGNPVSSWQRNGYLTQGFSLPANAATGTYVVQVDHTTRPFDPSSVFNPQTTPVTTSYRHFFSVGCTPTKTIGNTITTAELGHIVGNDLHSTEIITTKKLYQAGDYIQLTPGFHAQAGCTLKARIKDCNYTE